MFMILNLFGTMEWLNMDKYSFRVANWKINKTREKYITRFSYKF